MIGVLSFCVALAATAPSAATWQTPLYVEVDDRANMYVDGARVDTLLVLRRQPVYFQKRDPAGPDLTILFEKRLFHPRHRIQVTLSDVGRPVYRKVDIGANMAVYTGLPKGGFNADLPPYAVLPVRVVPPPAR